ncbi:thymidylate synthase [Caudoviricetes sp.]|nr:thymidylate synthase [Caudoviricetes sp.]
MRFIDTQYAHLVLDALGVSARSDRTGVGTHSSLFPSYRIDWNPSLASATPQDQIPLITTKPVNISAIGKELAWFIAGRTNTKDLDCKIWDAWAQPDGECGPIYGAQWRGNAQDPTDQLAETLALLKRDRYTRRAIISAWSPSEISKMALPPCHTLFQFGVSEDPDQQEALSLCLYQRSADLALGVPFNIVSYWLLLKLCATYLDMPAYRLVINYGDLHVYKNHAEKLRTQISRKLSLCNVHAPLSDAVHDAFAALIVDKNDHDAFLTLRKELSELRTDFVCPHPVIKYEVAV